MTFLSKEKKMNVLGKRRKNIAGPSPSEIRDFLKQHPTMPNEDVIAVIGCDRGRLYAAREAIGISQKRVPVEQHSLSKLKTVRLVTLQAKDDRIALLEKQVEALRLDNPQAEIHFVESSGEKEWKSKLDAAVHHINHLEKHIESIDKQITGYKAVINYLEHQLAAKHGTSV